MASSIPAARTGLHDLLNALTATTLTGVHVARTGLWKDVGEHDSIIIGNATDIDREWPGAGATQFKESYLLPVHVAASASGSDLQAVEQRLWDLVTIVEQTAIANRHLGGLLIHMLPAGAREGEESGPTDNSRVIARLTLNLSCLASVVLS